MTNKYQKALETIWKMFDVKFGVKEMDKAIEFLDCKNTLQELIDKMKFVEKVQTPDYIRVQNLNEKLQLALDKACEELFISVGVRNKETWKEWALKESEK